MELEIISARYGGRRTYADVTERVRREVRADGLRIAARNAVLGIDPLPNVAKQLVVFWRLGAAYAQTAVPEGYRIDLSPAYLDVLRKEVGSAPAADVTNPCLPEVLHEVRRLAQGLGLRWWLEFGTALGAGRDGRIIPYDNDVDIGVLLEEADFRNLWWWFRSMSSRRFQVKELPDRLLRVVFDGSWCDIWAFRRDGTGVAKRLNRYAGSLKYLPAGADHFSMPDRFLDSLGRIAFLGADFPIPQPVDEFLRFRYGETFRLPVSWRLTLPVIQDN